MKYTLLLVACLCAIIKSTSAEDNCEAAAKCSTCLRAGGTCKWCADEDYDAEEVRRPRCNTLEKLNENNCKNIQIDDGTSSQTDNEFGEKIQLSPLKVELTLRPGQPKSFKLSVKPAENYPVRLYYLMDMSNSMQDDLENLKGLGTVIAKEIKNITTNFQLAFGTFVDKTIPPYVWLTQTKPCSVCVPAFGYQHVFDFNENAQLFEAAVSKQKISGNLDSPEGGFDALMQVAVCGDKIWPVEDYARKIVLYVTDATPHIAGDGKLGGITVPNDGKCHLESKDNMMYYTRTNDMDYPSVSFLRQKLQESEIIPIIASVKILKRIYGALADEWEVLGTSFGTLEKDSSNIVTLIKDNYKKISSTIRLHDNSPENMEVKYESGCDGSTSGNQCSNVRINQQVNFTVSVTAIKCPVDDAVKTNGETFAVTIPGFGNVKVDVKYICDCACDLETGELASPKCNRTGTFKCGICDCDEGRFGKHCQCDSDVQEDDALCILVNSTDTEVCSGSGSCICGTCVCNVRSNRREIISGKYCQCNNFGCDRHNGKICGGDERGICKCGKCECKDPYIDDNCGEKNCTLGMRECAKDGKECSGNGKCNCGDCECQYGYEGKHCDVCRDCDERCKLEEKCVLCHEPYEKGDDSVCAACNVHIVLVNKTEGEGKKCQVRYNATCTKLFNVSSESDIIYMQNTLYCDTVVSGDADILPIVLGIIGGIVLLGLIALLIWKLLVTLFDMAEWKNFQNEIAGAPKSDQNPLYREPQQKFNNPVYVGAQA